MRLGYPRFHAIKAIAFLFFPDRRTADHLAVVIAGKFHLPFKLLRQQKVIGIQVLQPFAFCELEESISRRAATPVGACLPPNSTIEFPDDLQAAIRRAIIDDDNFFLRPGLRKRAFDRLRDPLLRIKARDQDRD